ncbi:MAG TPA: ATP-binding protein [Spirochaetia bacterium]|nr:ATP-binding protein [Spirochaetia bacterium]
MSESEAASLAPRKLSTLAIAVSVAFLVAFPPIAHFVDGGEIFGGLIVIPLSLIAWSWGYRRAILTAAIAVVCAETLFAVEYFVVHHKPLTPYWLLGTLCGVLVIPTIATVVGKLSEALTRQRIAEEHALKSHQHVEALLSALPDIMFEIDRGGRLHVCRALNASHFFVDPEQCIGRTVGEVLPASAAEAIMEALAVAGSLGKSARGTYSLSVGNSVAWFELSIAPVGDFRNPECHFVALSRDVTDQKTLEQQLLQSQKMEAVGRLAGGVAHDFNNILLVILGFCDLIEGHLEDQNKVRAEVAVIRESASRAAALTKQLLAFSRKDLRHPRVLDVLDVIQRMEPMLGRALGEDVALSVVADEMESSVSADEGQLQQVIMNLAVNSRDAMPNGGRLIMKVENVTFAGTDPHDRPGMLPGDYVRLSVSDTGSGMDAETLAHLFEPFFTTKEAGKGTGLGLSIVYGIVKQSEGYVYVESKVGRGATFSIYLPRVAGDTEESIAHVDTMRHERGSETVLVAEDDAQVRNLVIQNLENHGYRVLSASTGTEALRVSEQQGEHVDVLLTDLVMPGISGAKVAEGFRKSNPRAPIILMTGYAATEDALREGNGFTYILRKPFRARDLLSKIAEALGSR